MSKTKRKTNKSKDAPFTIGLSVYLEDEKIWEQMVSFSSLLKPEHMKKLILRWLNRADSIIIEKHKD